MSLPDNAWDPTRGRYVRVTGETTVGTSVAPHTVRGARLTPRQSAKFKSTFGVCTAVDTCHKIAGHAGDCT